MLLSELFKKDDKEKTELPGTYVAVRFDTESEDRLIELAKKLKVPNIIPKNELHVTLIYSRKHIDFKARGKLSKEEQFEVKPWELHIFNTRSGENCLVVKLKSPELNKRHKYIMDKYEATYDFPEYIAHVTLSYDCGDFKIPDDQSFLKEFEPLVVVEEYDEELKAPSEDSTKPSLDDSKS